MAVKLPKHLATIDYLKYEIVKIKTQTDVLLFELEKHDCDIRLVYDYLVEILGYWCTAQRILKFLILDLEKKEEEEKKKSKK